MAPSIKLCTTLSSDRTAINLTVNIDDRESSFLRLDALEVEQFIDCLASLRSKLADAVPVRLEPYPRLNAIVNPPWAAMRVDERSTKGRLLAFRHPGLGWVSFIFTTQEAAKLAPFLAELATDCDASCLLEARDIGA